MPDSSQVRVPRCFSDQKVSPEVSLTSQVSSQEMDILYDVENDISYLFFFLGLHSRRLWGNGDMYC